MIEFSVQHPNNWMPVTCCIGGLRRQDGGCEHVPRTICCGCHSSWPITSKRRGMWQFCKKKCPFSMETHSNRVKKNGTGNSKPLAKNIPCMNTVFAPSNAAQQPELTVCR